LTTPGGPGILNMMAPPHRIVWFSLSKALAESQRWAVDSFPTIVRRATGSSERWTLREQTYDAARETPMWRYEVQGVSDLDLVVDHIIHELTDAVLLTELHTVTEDAYTFGSMHWDHPAHAVQAPEQAIGESDR
jgi:hypothetical protein